MAIRRVEYVDQPLVMRRVTPSTAALAALYTRQGENLADIALRKGAVQARTLENLGGLYSNYLEQGRREQAAAYEAGLRERDRRDRLDQLRIEREERSKTRSEDLTREQKREDRAAARYMVDNTVSGPVSPALAEFARRFPETAVRFTDRTTLPATVTPGAVGEVSPEAQVYPVLEPSKDDLAKAATIQAQLERWKAEDAARTRDDVRQERLATATIENQKTMAGIAQQNANTARQNADTTKARYTGSGLDSTMPTKYQTALDRAILLVPATKRPAVVNVANRLWGEQNEAELKSVIKQAAIEGENVDTKNQIRARSGTIAALQSAMGTMARMKAAGVPLNWFTGSIEDLARKIGTSTDPRYVEFKNELEDTLINYRRAATGVAFGEREAAQYAGMFPNYKQTIPVSEAAIRGLTNAMAIRDRDYWVNKLGKDGADLVVGPAVQQFKPGDDPGGLGLGKPK